MKRFLLISLYLFLIASFAVNAQNPEFSKVQDGIEYAKVVRQSKSAEGKPENVVINLLRLDLSKVRLDVVHSLDAAIGVEKTSSIATRHGAIAAINAGFFRLDNSLYAGDDAGILQIDGKLLSESNNNRIALGIINGKDKTEVNFGHLDLNGIGVIEKNVLEFNGINRERKNDELIIFTPEFGRTTLTNPNGTEVIVKSGKVLAIVKTGSNLIPCDGFVLSGNGKAEETLLKSSKIGAKFRFNLMSEDSLIMLDDEKDREAEKKRREPLLFFDDDSFKKTEDIVGGVPQLIKNGKIEITWEAEKIGKSFFETHHPRTAVAKLKDGKFLMATIDGRSEESGGMSLPQLADFLLEMGAVEAMNLDGGGSTTMFLDGKVVNKPSDKEGERQVSDAILVFPRAK